METRNLGQLRTPALGLGCMGMTFAYAKADPARCLRTLDRALDNGVRMFDTADIYGPRTNEELLAGWLADKRERVQVATKFGARSLEIEGRSPDGRPEYVGPSCDASLGRLGVDHIDLYYLHRVDPLVPIAETVGAMAELVTAGKVRHLGLSEASADDIRAAHEVHPITAVQTEYSLWTRDVEATVLPTLRELGIGLVAYSPLGRGFLTGAITRPEDLAAEDWRRKNPRFMGDNFDANLELVEELVAMAEGRESTAAKIALAWVLSRGDDIVAIPGTTRPKRVSENVGALDVLLTADDLALLESIAPPGVAAGNRYPAHSMGSLRT